MANNAYRTTWAILFALCTTSHAFGQLPPETSWSDPTFSHANYLSLPSPAYLDTVYDPNYNVNITRVSDEVIFGQSGASIHHQYSEVQAWNADSSKYWIGFNHILNDSDNTVFKTLNVPMHDGRWSEVDPNIRYYSFGNQLRKIDVITEQVTTLHVFPGYGQINIGDYHGQISQDEKVVITEEKSGGKAALFDLVNNVVLTEFTMPSYDATLTRSGKYIQVHNTNGTASYYDWENDLGLSNPTLTLPVAHDNFAYDSNGDEVVINLTPLRMYRLSDGLMTDLLPATPETAGTCEENSDNPFISGHVSTPTDLPGWALVSAGVDDCNDPTVDGFYHKTEQFLVKLDGSGTIRPFGFSRSSYQAYLREAKSAVRRDGQKVTFTSDWWNAGLGLEDTVQYVVETASAIIVGDFNTDGFVDGADFLEWQRNPNIGSLSDWEANFGTAPSSLATSSAVPEPTAGVLAIAMLLCVVGARAKRQATSAG